MSIRIADIGDDMNLPADVRAKLAGNFGDPSTVEGAQLSATFVPATRVTELSNPSSIDPLKMYAKAATSALAIPTYLVPDTNQATHSSVLAFTKPFAGYEYWMGFTPYPGGANAQENPSVIASHDGVNWVVPDGLTNPIDLQSGGTLYNSDTELVLGPDHQLWLMWRTVDTTNSQEILYLSKSADGVVWSAKVAVYTQPWATRRLLSPTLVFENGAWTLWAVDLVPTPNTIIRMRSTGPDLTGNSSWNAPTVCTFGALVSGKEPWHIQVRKVGGSQYVALMCDNVTDSGGSKDSSLILMVSADGVTWSNGTGSVIPVRVPNVYNRLYRSSFVPMFVDGELVLRTWYAGVLDTTTPPTWRLFLTDIHSSTIGDTAPLQLLPGEPIPAWLPANRSIIRLHAGGSAEVRRNKARMPSPVAPYTGWQSGYAGAGGTFAANAYTTGGPSKGSPNRYVWVWSVAPMVATVYGSYSNGVNGIAVTPGTVMTFSAWMKPSWAGASTALRILWYTAANAIIGGEVLGEALLHKAATWERRDLVAVTVPATAAYALVRFYSQNGTIPVGASFELSSLLPEVAEHVRDYFDGSMIPFQDSTVTASWAGTAWASESILTAASSYRQFWDGTQVWAV